MAKGVAVLSISRGVSGTIYFTQVGDGPSTVTGNDPQVRNASCQTYDSPRTSKSPSEECVSPTKDDQQEKALGFAGIEAYQTGHVDKFLANEQQHL